MATLTMERNFDASPERVFEFLTQTGNLLEWWGPEGTIIKDHNLDFSKPGPWKATMVGPQGHGAMVGGEVVGIEPPCWVELTLSFAGEGGEAGEESLIRFEVKSDGRGGTDFLLTQSGLREEYIEDMRNKGWNAAFDRLRKLVEQN
jgi:uncharacterized protein YndB with AHSA1/START domain